MQIRIWPSLKQCFLAMVVISGMGYRSLCAEEVPVHSSASAVSLMELAHAGRAEWANFPGFQATVTLTADATTAKTTLHVSPDGKIELTPPLGEQFRWSDRVLKSVIGHRLTQEPAITHVEFADDQVNHPHGRLLRSTNPQEKSMWRVQGDVMTEVHRETDKSRFIISIGDVWRTPENKHLPKDFVVTTWELPSHQIKTARQVHQEWIRIGTTDLPAEFWAITNDSSGKTVSHRIQFDDHKLLPLAAETTTLK